MKNKKSFFYIGTGIVIVLIFVICGIFCSKKDNPILLYSDIQGLVEGKREIITFSVDFGDKIEEDIVVELYTNDSIIKEMNDKGEDGDKFAGDHIYSCTQSVGLSAGESIIYYAKYKNRKSNELIIRGFDVLTEESYNHSTEVMSEIRSSADKYIDSETGYVSYKDVKKAVKEVCDYAEKMQESGEVLDVENNEDSALIRTNNGIWYAYQPNVEGVDAFGTNVDLDIITMEPWYNYGSKSQIRHYEHTVDAANIADKYFDNLNYVSKYKDENVTLNRIKSLKENEVILITTHGGYSNSFGPYITTGERYTFLDELSWDAIWGNIILTEGEESVDNRIAISSGYIDKYIGNLEHSFVYLGACKSAMDYRLAISFRKKGADVVLGYTDTVNSLYNRKMLVSLIERMCTFFDEIDEYGNVGHAILYARDVNGNDDSKYKDYSPAQLIYYGEQDYRFYNKYIEEMYEATADIDEFNLETYNDFYYEHGFDKIREIKVGEMTNATTYIVNSKNKPIAKASSLYQISKYYRFEGNDTFTKKDGYEWCYYQYTSPTNQNGYGDNEYVSTQITDCLRYFENPIWKNNINSKGFYEFSVTTDDGTFDECLFICKKRKTSTDDIANCWIRIPRGYDGITILHGCMEGWEYKQKYGKYPDYSVDLITDNTSFFRLTNY